MHGLRDDKRQITPHRRVARQRRRTRQWPHQQRIELKLEAVRAYATELRAKNNAVNAAIAALDAARAARNRELYEPDKGLVDLCLTAKLYVKAIFGQSSPEYKQVAKVEFQKNLI